MSLTDRVDAMYANGHDICRECQRMRPKTEDRARTDIIMEFKRVRAGTGRHCLEKCIKHSV
jgi:hypothetical protein